MIKLDYAHICDYTFTDPEGKLYLLGIFNHIYSEKYPAVHPSLVVFSAWSGELDESSDIVLIIKDSDGEKLIEVKAVEIVMHQTEHRLASRVTNLRIPREGDYSVLLFADGKLVRELPLFASIVEVKQGADHAS